MIDEYGNSINEQQKELLGVFETTFQGQSDVCTGLFRGKLSVTSFSGDENGVDAGDRRF